MTGFACDIARLCMTVHSCRKLIRKQN